MASVPRNYPFGSNDDEIISIIKELSTEIISSGANINHVMRISPLITIGQTELQKRFIERTHEITKQLNSETQELKKTTQSYNSSSESFSKASRNLSVLAIIISILAIGVSVYFSVTNEQSNENWQSAQLRVLGEINSKIDNFQKLEK